MIENTCSTLPDIDLAPAARVLTAGTIARKRIVADRTDRDAAFFALVGVASGFGFIETNESGHRDVRQGDIFLLFPGIAHTYGPAGDGIWDEAYLTFDGCIFDTLVEAGLLRPAEPVMKDLVPTWLDRLLSLIRLAARRERTPDAVYVAMLFGLLCEMTSAEAPKHLSVTDRSWVDGAYKAFAADSPMRISLSDVARRMGTSYGSFVKRFTRLTGISPGKAQTRVIMDRAAALLRSESMSVAQIADHLGFCDAAYFSRRFRQHTGLSPGEFRGMAQPRMDKSMSRGCSQYPPQTANTALLPSRSDGGIPGADPPGIRAIAASRRPAAAAR